jgi:competence protein ComEA
MFQLTRDEQALIAVILLTASVVVTVVVLRGGSETFRGDFVTLPESNTVDPAASDDAGAGEGPMVVVHVSGQVMRPSVYRVPEGTRVYEVVRMAGLRPGADANRLNLADVVHDREKIVVPGRDTAETTSDAPLRISAGRVNINSASIEELVSLCGIGPVYAKRIVEYRTKYRFKRIEDIVKVNGIGQRTFEAIKDDICVD